MKTFSEKVVELALDVPKGRVTTYGNIAKAAGGGGPDGLAQYLEYFGQSVGGGRASDPVAPDCLCRRQRMAEPRAQKAAPSNV